MYHGYGYEKNADANTIRVIGKTLMVPTPDQLTTIAEVGS